MSNYTFDDDDDISKILNKVCLNIKVKEQKSACRQASNYSKNNHNNKRMKVNEFESTQIHEQQKIIYQ
jgi:hypothetical protein